MTSAYESIHQIAATGKPLARDFAQQFLESLESGEELPAAIPEPKLSPEEIDNKKSEVLTKKGHENYSALEQLRANLGESDIPFLRQVVAKHRHMFHRTEVADILGEIGGAEATALLIEMLNVATNSLVIYYILRNLIEEGYTLQPYAERLRQPLASFWDSLVTYELWLDDEISDEAIDTLARSKIDLSVAPSKRDYNWYWLCKDPKPATPEITAPPDEPSDLP